MHHAASDDITGLARPGVSCRHMADRHTLMVVCTTTGNLWDPFIKRPRQTSMYYHYGRWRGHDSTPRWGLNSPIGAELRTG